MPNDPTRREFFRTFGRETVRNAGAVAGAAAELRRRSGEAARELLDMGRPGVDGVTTAPEKAIQGSVAAFHSAYRLSGGALLILDQRDLPSRVSIITCREPSEVASAIRLGVVNAGPVLGELAAYAMAIASADSADADRAGRDQQVRAAANTLRGARSDVSALRAAADRMEARYEELTAGDGAAADGHALAASMRDEADAIATEAQAAHAALGRAGAEGISGLDGSINMLMHADMGPLSCGMVGTGTALLQNLAAMGHKVHVWVTDAAPGMEGTRIAAYQLTQMEIPHTVIPDTSVSWVLSTRHLDGALLRADTVGANAETLAPVGSLNVAQLAVDAGVAVYVLAPPSSFAPSGVDPASLLFDLRSHAESGARSGTESASRPPALEARLAPTTDLIPAHLVTAFITDTGLRPAGRS